MDIVLIAGLWLDGSAWDDVLPELEARGHRGIAVTLPGQGDGATAATYDDQVAAVLAAVDAADGAPLVVGHSAACTLAWVAADQRPDAITGVALIGGFPSTDGEKYADFFEPVDGAMPFPGWEKFEGPDSDDMSEELKADLLARMIPVPVGGDPRRGALDERRAPRRAAHADLPGVQPGRGTGVDRRRRRARALATATALELVDLDSGHWPMFTQPAALAALLDDATRR